MLCKTFFCNNIDQLEEADCDIAFFIFNGKISLSEELKKPSITKRLAQLSYARKLLLFMNFVAEIEDRQYHSVLVIDNGKILGVSDSVTDESYCLSDRQRIYVTHLGKAGVIVGKDVLAADSVRNLFISGADFAVHMSSAPVDNYSLRALKSHSFFYAFTIFSVFNDAFFVSSRGLFPNLPGSKVDAELTAPPREGARLTEFLQPSFEY